MINHSLTNTCERVYQKTLEEPTRRDYCNEAAQLAERLRPRTAAEDQTIFTMVSNDQCIDFDLCFT